MTHVISLDPLSGVNPTNRERIYADLRERMPIYWSSIHTGWVLTRYADVSAVLRHPDALALGALPFLQSISQRSGLDLSNLINFVGSLSLFTRPPRHGAIRRLLAQALGATRHFNFPQLLDQRADTILEAGARDGAIDLASGYGKNLALFTIGTFLGIPDEDVSELGALASDFVVVFERVLPSVRSLKELDKSSGLLMDYFARLLTSRRENLADDGISIIVRLADQDLQCSNEELAGYCTFFFMAAEITTAAAISTAALLLLQRPALRAQLSSDHSQISRAAGEFLRLASPVQYVARQLRSDFEIAGQTVHADQPIMLMLGAANRDPAVFPNPDEPDLDRSGPEALVFAAGPYRCVGAQLATFEVELAVRKLLEWPQLRLAPQPPIWSDRMNVAPLLRLEAHYT